MNWLREVNALLIVLVFLGTVPLLIRVNSRGAQQLRSFMVYTPILIWIVVAGASVITGYVLTKPNPGPPNLATFGWTGMLLCILIAETILVHKYRSIPRHSAKGVEQQPPAVPIVTLLDVISPEEQAAAAARAKVAQLIDARVA